MSIWKLTTLGIAILLLTFAGSISPGAVSAQQTSACTELGDLSNLVQMLLFNNQLSGLFLRL